VHLVRLVGALADRRSRPWRWHSVAQSSADGDGGYAVALPTTNRCIGADDNVVVVAVVVAAAAAGAAAGRDGRQLGDRPRERPLAQQAGS